MGLKCFVKVNKINNLSDARYSAGMGVDCIGFCFDSSDLSCIAIEKYKEIVGWVSGVKIVGEFDSASLEEIKGAVEAYHPDFIQVSDPLLVDYLTLLNKPIILKLKVTTENILKTRVLMEEKAGKVHYFLLESDEVSLIPQVKDLSTRYRVLLGFGVSTNNLNEIISSSIKGIAIDGEHEEKPGLKEFGDLADILEWLSED